MKCELVTITPQIAEKLLKKNNHNRTLNLRHAEALADEIREGRWKVNGDTICINGETLIDGQHRLQAVVLSGMPIQSLFVDGLPSDVFNTKDIGKKRSAADTLSVLGKKNSKRLASALVLVDKYFTGRSTKNVRYSNTEVEGLLNKYPDIEGYLLVNTKGRGLIAPAVLDTCYYLFSKKDQELADEFVEKVIKGTGLEEKSPFYLLRERLVANSLSKAKLSREYILALCIKAWNYRRSGSRLRALRWRDKGNTPEAFPVVQ